jgi:hypothetical protein
MKTTAKRSTVIAAINRVNEAKGYRIRLETDKQDRKWYHFTIRSAESGIPGSRYSYSGRRLTAASWHAHGFIFDEIFKIEPDAVIKSLKKEITKDYGNWEDIKIGSMVCPMYMSETSIL